MKAFESLAVMVVSLIFLVGLASPVLSAEVGTQVKPQIGPKVGVPVISMPCPTGWHVKSGTPGKSRYTCVPDKPKPIQCPAGYVYFDNSEAGCFVGCNEVIK